MRATDGQITGGVAVEIGRSIAQKLGVPFELVSLPNADAYIQSFGKGEWDIAIGASSPLVAEKLTLRLDASLRIQQRLTSPESK